MDLDRRAVDLAGVGVAEIAEAAHADQLADTVAAETGRELLPLGRGCAGDMLESFVGANGEGSAEAGGVADGAEGAVVAEAEPAHQLVGGDPCAALQEIGFDFSRFGHGVRMGCGLGGFSVRR